MSLSTYSFPMNGGMDRSVSSLLADKGTFYELHNIRHSLTQKGLLTQTPYFQAYQTTTQGTYWTGGASATESSGSSHRLNSAGFKVTDAVFWDLDSNQLQAFYQTTYPAAETIYTGLRLVVNTVTGLAITLGSTLDVEMTGAAAFRWRKNGGGWTAGVPAITGVSIDGGNATLYFLATSGYAGTEAWAWTRTDASFDGSASTLGTFPLDFVYYKQELYFLNTNGRLCILKNSTTGMYVVSVGYRPVWGNYVTEYQDHLIVGGFSKTVSTGSRTQARTLGWSDVTDVEQFIPTDTNEADSFVLPTSTQNDVPPNYGDVYNPIRGLAVINQQFFAFTSAEAYTSIYLGLPLVFSFSKFADIELTNPILAENQSVIRGEFGVYLLLTTDIVFFNGTTFKSIGSPVLSAINPVYDKFTAYVDFGNYNRRHKELLLVVQTKAYVFQERWGTWYTRAIDFGYTVRCVCSDYFAVNGFIIGCSSRRLFVEDIGWDTQPVFDASGGTVYATPKLTTHLIGGPELADVKEIAGLRFGATSTLTGSAQYSSGSGNKINVFYFKSDNGFITGSATDAGIQWSSATVESYLPLRTSFRSIAIELRFAGTASLPPSAMCLTSLTVLGKNLPSVEKVEK